MISAPVASVSPVTEAEGPGVRYALWFQGCPLRCPGCCNPEYLPFTGGTPRGVDELLGEIRESREQFGVEGITLLGGEPFAHAEPASMIAAGTQAMGLSVMVFSGFTLEHLRDSPEPHVRRLLQHTDLLVDGPYVREQPDTTRRWIGSTNQRIHFLTGRHRADDPSWVKPNTLEIRVRGKEILVNGFPAAEAKGLWKGWKRKR